MCNPSVDLDGFVVGSADCAGCGSIEVLTGLVFLVKAGLGPIRCLLISRELMVSWARLGGCLKDEREGAWQYFSTGLLFFKHRL